MRTKVTKNIERHTDPNGGHDQNEIKRNKALNYFKQKLPYISVCNTNLPRRFASYFVLVISAAGNSVPFIFCILKFLLIRHSHRFVAVVIHTVFNST